MLILKNVPYIIVLECLIITPKAMTLHWIPWHVQDKSLVAPSPQIIEFVGPVKQ